MYRTRLIAAGLTTLLLLGAPPAIGRSSDRGPDVVARAALGAAASRPVGSALSDVAAPALRSVDQLPVVAQGTGPGSTTTSPSLPALPGLDRLAGLTGI